MNKYFKELMDRLNKSSDIPVAFKPNELVISKEIAFAIISDINRRYNNCLWRNKIVSFPKNIYGESSRPVLVKYKDKNTDPEVCSFNFITNKFVFMDKDVTELVEKWCEIPGYEYDE